MAVEVPETHVRILRKHRWVGYIEVPLDGPALQLWKDRSFDQFGTRDVSYSGPVCSECSLPWPNDFPCEGHPFVSSG